MQGSRIESTRSNWKQAVKKYNPPGSKIFGGDRDLPNKFSPAKFNIMQTNNSRSLIRNRTNNYSHDEIQLEQSRERSKSKQLELRKGQTMNPPPSIKFDSEMQVLRKGVQSQKSIDFEIKRNVVHSKSKDIDIVKELKDQFVKFKHKILKELARQEQQLKNTIQYIYQKMGTLSNCQQSPINFKSSPSHSKTNQIFTPLLQTYQSPISKYLQTFSKQISSRIETAPQRNSKVVANSVALQCINPQIKERMLRMQQLISNLKQDLNDHSPRTREEPLKGEVGKLMERLFI